MRKNDWWVDVLLFVALVVVLMALALAIAGLVIQLMWQTADARAQEIMAEARARIVLYEMAQIPATERPAAAGVIYEPPTPEPSEAPVPGVTFP